MAFFVSGDVSNLVLVESVSNFGTLVGEQAERIKAIKMHDTAAIARRLILGLGASSRTDRDRSRHNCSTMS